MGVFPVRNNQIKAIKACRRARIFCAFWFGANSAAVGCRSSAKPKLEEAQKGSHMPIKPRGVWDFFHLE